MCFSSTSLTFWILLQFHPEPISLSHHLIHFPLPTHLVHYSACNPGCIPTVGLQFTTAHRSRLTYLPILITLPPFTGCPVFQPLNNLPTPEHSFWRCLPSHSFHSGKISYYMKKSPYIIPDAAENIILFEKYSEIVVFPLGLPVLYISLSLNLCYISVL